MSSRLDRRTTRLEVITGGKGRTYFVVDDDPIPPGVLPKDHLIRFRSDPALRRLLPPPEDRPEDRPEDQPNGA